MNFARPKKYLGQNFLTDPRIKKKIIDACRFKTDEDVLEIGPGRGALTQIIRRHVHQLYAVEKDKSLADFLKSNLEPRNVEVIAADFLKLDLRAFKGAKKIIGNIPYNISTPIIEKLIKHRHQIQDAYLTVQKEFAKRLAAGAGTKDYGSLSCFVQYFAEVKILFQIPKEAFQPVPKVTSNFISLRFRDFPVRAADEDFLFQLIRRAFEQRRKMIRNSLTSIIQKDAIGPILSEVGLSEKDRPEDIPLRDFIRLANQAVEMTKKGTKRD